MKPLSESMSDPAEWPMGAILTVGDLADIIPAWSEDDIGMTTLISVKGAVLGVEVVDRHHLKVVRMPWELSGD